MSKEHLKPLLEAFGEKIAEGGYDLSKKRAVSEHDGMLGIEESSLRVGQWIKQQGSDWTTYGVVTGVQANGAAKAVVFQSFGGSSSGSAKNQSLRGWTPSPVAIDKSAVPPKIAKKIEDKAGPLSEAKGACKNCGCPCKPDDMRDGNCRKCASEIELGDKLPPKGFSESIVPLKATDDKEHNWKSLAQKLLDKSTGQSEEEFGYRVYLRAMIAGQPTGHLVKIAGPKGEGAKKARQAVIDLGGTQTEATATPRKGKKIRFKAGNAVYTAVFDRLATNRPDMYGKESEEMWRVKVQQPGGMDYVRYISPDMVVESVTEALSDSKEDPFEVMRRECNEIIRKEALDGQRPDEEEFDNDILKRLQKGAE